MTAHGRDRGEPHQGQARPARQVLLRDLPGDRGEVVRRNRDDLGRHAAPVLGGAHPEHAGADGESARAQLHLVQTGAGTDHGARHLAARARRELQVLRPPGGAVADLVVQRVQACGTATCRRASPAAGWGTGASVCRVRTSGPPKRSKRILACPYDAPRTDISAMGDHGEQTDAPRPAALPSRRPSAIRPDPQQWRDLLLREESSSRRSSTRCPPSRPAATSSPPRCAAEAMPAVPIAAMDGFAVRRTDLVAPGRTTLPVSAELPARPGRSRPSRPGPRARIMTGAAVPRGADAVIEVEASDAVPFGPVPAAVTFTLVELPPSQRHVRVSGEEVAREELLAAAGDRVGPGLVGASPARSGWRPCLYTADTECAWWSPGTSSPMRLRPAPGSVRESTTAPCSPPRCGPTAPRPCLRCTAVTTHAGLRDTLARAAADSDLVLTTGGIGHGAFDVVKTLLGESGSGSSCFAHLALRPGGPAGMGAARRRGARGAPARHPRRRPGRLPSLRAAAAGRAEASAVRTVLLGDVSADTGRRRPGAVHAMAGHLRPSRGRARGRRALLPGQAPGALRAGRRDRAVRSTRDRGQVGPGRTALRPGDRDPGTQSPTATLELPWAHARARRRPRTPEAPSICVRTAPSSSAPSSA